MSSRWPEELCRIEQLLVVADGPGGDEQFAHDSTQGDQLGLARASSP
jgi:hypothetical protein